LVSQIKKPVKEKEESRRDGVLSTKSFRTDLLGAELNSESIRDVSKRKREKKKENPERKGVKSGPLISD